MNILSKKRPRPKRQSPRTRLLSKAVVNWETGCWEWAGRLNGDGYASFTPVTGKSTFAHRYAYELWNGSIPAGLTLDHLCRVRHCINPAHLEPVTQRENTLRSPNTMASRHAAKTHCVNGHEFTPENTRIQKERGNRMTRVCRACHRERAQRARVARQGASA